jgi:ParB/RepB/Spo0J family partition protein
MDDTALDELCQSMRLNGFFGAVQVKRAPDGTFEVVAGHRRTIAAKRVGLASIRAELVTEAEAEALQVAENYYREDLTPAEEATFLQQLYVTRCGEDTDRLAELVRRPRAYVESRLLLLSGDPAVFEALRARRISLGVAQVLNAARKPGDAAYYLHHALTGGATVAIVRRWIDDANMRWADEEASRAARAASGEPEPEPAEPVPVVPSFVGAAKPHELPTGRQLEQCRACHEPNERFRMYQFLFCDTCATAYFRGDGPFAVRQ